MTRTMNDVYTYQQQALDLLDPDHPHYEEIKELLQDQIMDEVHDLNATYRRTTST